LIARKSRWRAGSIDNLCGFMLVDPDTGGGVDVRAMTLAQSM
jgi:hypothetical protein